MPKNPFYAEKVVLKNGGSIQTEAGTSIISISSAGVATVNTTTQTVTNLTTTGNTVIGDAASDTLTLNSLTTVATNQKIQFRDTALYISSKDDGHLDIDADTSIDLNGAVVTSSTITAGGKIALYAIGSAAQSASGLLMGIGTTANPALSSTAGANFVELRTKSTATSGDNRGIYLRHEIGGIGGGGEALRAFAKVTAAASTVRGAHISLDLDAAGTVSGFGAGVDAQVLYGNASYTNTVTAINAELYAAGSSTAIGAGTGSIIRVSVGGDSTGVADILSKAAFLSFTNAAGSAGLLDTDITALTGKAGLKVYVEGALYGYIPVVTGS